jgi:hypothetical protein
MRTQRRTKAEAAPTRDARTVVVAREVPGGWSLLSARARDGGIEITGSERFEAADRRAREWVDASRAARTVCVIDGGRCVARAVQLPSAPEPRLESALELNATTFVLGRTPPWRVASAMLPRERGDGIRTGLVLEWPDDGESAPSPEALAEEQASLWFTPEVTGLAALTAWCEGPLVSVDARHGVAAVCVPTTRGLLARTFRAGGGEDGITRDDVVRAVGESCVHAGVPGDETAAAVKAAGEAADRALPNGFGCTASDRERLAEAAAAIPAADHDAWWREHGVEAGIALASFGAAAPLTRLRPADPGARPDRAARMLGWLSRPGTARRVLVAAIAILALAPPAFEGARLLLLRWKLPDPAAYERAEESVRKRLALYRVLSRQGASMNKVLSDLASCAPDGIDVDFINVSANVKGPAVTVRGRVRPSGTRQGVEVLIDFERQLRESGAFDSISRSSEAPDARGMQEFTVNATAIKPTYTVAFPADQDFAKTSMRERRYGPPPEDVDTVASGLDTAPEARSAARPSDAVPQAPAAQAASAGAPAPAREPAAVAAASDEATEAPAAEATDGTRAATGERTAPRGGGRQVPGSSRASGLATRSNPGATAEPEPLPPPLTPNEIQQMTKQEAQQAMTAVARVRNRADVSDADKARLKAEFDLLLERCKRP